MYDIHIGHLTPIPYLGNFEILSKIDLYPLGFINSLHPQYTAFQLLFLPGYLCISKPSIISQISSLARPHLHLGIFLPNYNTKSMLLSFSSILKHLCSDTPLVLLSTSLAISIQINFPILLLTVDSPSTAKNKNNKKNKNPKMLLLRLAKYYLDRSS